MGVISSIDRLYRRRLLRASPSARSSTWHVEVMHSDIPRLCWEVGVELGLGLMRPEQLEKDITEGRVILFGQPVRLGPVRAVVGSLA